LKAFILFLGVLIICLILTLISQPYLTKHVLYAARVAAAQLLPGYSSLSTQISSLNTTSPTANGSFLTYQNKGELRMTMEYPFNWKTILTDDKALIFLPPSKKDHFPERLVVALFDVGTNVSVNRLSDQALNNYVGYYDDFFIIDLKPTTFQGKPAYVLSYSYTNPAAGKIVAMDVGIKDGNHAYIISYSTEQSEYHNYISTVQKMIDSFRMVS
jgi:PsbP-like protein